MLHSFTPYFHCIRSIHANSGHSTSTLAISCAPYKWVNPSGAHGITEVYLREGFSRTGVARRSLAKVSGRRDWLHRVYPLESRAELKVTHLRWQSPNCGFLRFSAKIFGFLRKSAVICGFLRPPNAGISRRRGESAKICGFLRKSAFWALSVTLVPSP